MENYKVVLNSAGQHSIKSLKGGILPKSLKGKYSSVKDGMEAVKLYLALKASAEAELKVLKKRKALQDKKEKTEK
jgi:hypothetical protein